MLHKFITNLPLNFMLIFLVLPHSLWGVGNSAMQTALGESFPIRVMMTTQERNQGLSGVKPSAFKINEGMLFVFEDHSERSFWMPDTYFNLDIIFMDSIFKVVAIASNMKAHPGIKEPPAIERTPIIVAQYVLEVKAGSELSKKIKVGDLLKWPLSHHFLKKESKTHPVQ